MEVILIENISTIKGDLELFLIIWFLYIHREDVNINHVKHSICMNFCDCFLQMCKLPKVQMEKMPQ